MNNIKYELKALIIGIIANFLSSIVGFYFFYRTKSVSILLDSLISLILLVSTIISIFVCYSVRQKETKVYPLGRYTIENIFVLFRSILMIGTIIFTIIEGAYTITQFYSGIPININLDNKLLIIYGLSMTLLCSIILIAYKSLNKKANSEILKIEIKASLFDILSIIVAIGSLLIFSNVSFLKNICDIGDSITVIILSIFYIITPIKELINQTKILTDRRRNQDYEKEAKAKLKTLFPEFNFVDVYVAFNGNTHVFYISLFPQENLDYNTIKLYLNKIHNHIYNVYPESLVYTLLSEDMIHNM